MEDELDTQGEGVWSQAIPIPGAASLMCLGTVLSAALHSFTCYPSLWSYFTERNSIAWDQQPGELLAKLISNSMDGRHELGQQNQTTQESPASWQRKKLAVEVRGMVWP